MIQSIYSGIVHFHETDAGQVVHHSNYLKYMESARIALLSEHGLSYKAFQEEQIGLVPVRISIDYIKPLRQEDPYEVHTCLSIRSKASLSAQQNIWSNQHVVCRATIILACINEAKIGRAHV